MVVDKQQRVRKRVRKPRMAGTQRALGQALGVTDRTVREWTRRSDWPFGGAPYPIAAVRRWRSATLTQGNGHEPSEARRRIDEERAEILRLRRQQLEGTLVPHDAVEKMAADLTAVYLAEIEALPQRLCRQLAGMDVAEVRAGLREAVDAIRDRLTDRMEHG